MTKEQMNIRVSPAIREYIEFLVGKYGSITAVIEVAVALLYTKFVNETAPRESGEN